MEVYEGGEGEKANKKGKIDERLCSVIIIMFAVFMWDAELLQIFQHTLITNKQNGE